MRLAVDAFIRTMVYEYVTPAKATSAPATIRFFAATDTPVMLVEARVFPPRALPYVLSHEVRGGGFYFLFA